MKILKNVRQDLSCYVFSLVVDSVYSNHSFGPFNQNLLLEYLIEKTKFSVSPRKLYLIDDNSI